MEQTETPEQLDLRRKEKGSKDKVCFLSCKRPYLDCNLIFFFRRILYLCGSDHKLIQISDYGAIMALCKLMLNKSWKIA